MKRIKLRDWLFLSVLTVLPAIGLISFTGCEPDALTDVDGQVAAQGDPSQSGASQTGGQLVSTRIPDPRGGAVSIPDARGSMLPVRSPQTLLIATFNIQVFGEKKIGNTVLAERIAAIIRQFDVVAIQEVRATNQTIIQQLLQYVNVQGARYDYLIGPRLGRTSSKEQYAYLYDTTKVIGSPNASYTIQDDADLLHREPLVARFVTRVPPGYRPFSFSVVNIHTDPDEVKDEIPVMHQVLKNVREFEWLSAQEDDVLLMGDLNAAPSQFGELGRMPGIYWVIEGQSTMSKGSKTNDNIIFDRGLTNEFTGRAGVLDVSAFFNINREDAAAISDHMPVWAEFVMTEQQPDVSAGTVTANGPSNTSARR